MDLGTKIDKNSPMTAESTNTTSYPGVSLNDDAASALEDGCDCDLDIGTTFTATATFKVVGKRDDQFGKSINLDMVSMDDVKASESEDGNGEEESETPSPADSEDSSGEENEGEEESETPSPADSEAEEKMLGYKRPKPSKARTPSISAKLLED